MLLFFIYAAHAATFVVRAIRRVFIWYMIPFRIMEELLLCLKPKTDEALHNHMTGDDEVDWIQLKMPAMLPLRSRLAAKIGLGATGLATKKALLPKTPKIVPIPKDATAQPASSDGSQSDGAAAPASIDAEQRKLWEQEAATGSFWNENSHLSGLHKLNGIRLVLVGEAYLKTVSGLENTWEDSMMTNRKFLTGAKIVDVCCGGGVFTEAMAEAGANVTGFDEIPDVIEVAQRHWDMFHTDDYVPGRKKPDTTLIDPQYVCQPLDTFAEKNAGEYDVVVCSGVLEHIVSHDDYIRNCCKLARPGGAIVFTTMNRTLSALLGAIILPEDVLGVMPRYCHRLYRCVKPEEIMASAAKSNCKEVKTSGMMFLPGGLQPRDTRWVKSDFIGMNYAMVLKRAQAAA